MPHARRLRIAEAATAAAGQSRLAAIDHGRFRYTNLNDIDQGYSLSKISLFRLQKAISSLSKLFKAGENILVTGWLVVLLGCLEARRAI